MFFFDSHADTPSQLLRLRKIGEDNPYAQVDIPKMQRGGVSASFFALYTSRLLGPDAATRYALQMLAAVYDASERFPEALTPAFSPDTLHEGRISVFIGMENGSPVQESLSLLRMFYRMGVRYLTLTHNGDNALADSAAEGRRWGGLSPFGRQAVAEMNALGMMIDLSHASDNTFYDCIEHSRAPLICSHSCCRSLCRHPRNLTDDMLASLGEKDGYVGINFCPSFLSERFAADPAERALLEEGDRVEAAFIENPRDKRRADAWNSMQEKMRNEVWRPGVRKVADHIDHAVRYAGIDHVGIGTDFDGISVTPEGLDNISCMGLLWEELRRRGYTEGQIEQIAGLNFLNVFRKVVKYAESMR